MKFKIFLVVFTLLFLATEARAEFRAAVAVRVVTPAPLLPVSGGVGPSNPVNRKEGDLTVRALVLADDNTKVAIVSADFLGFPSVLGDQARAKVKGIPPQNILIGATHTHSAPDCYGFPDHEGKFATDLKYVDLVCNRIADAINEALGKLRPASLKIATGEAKGRIAFNYYAEQLYDPRCHVIQAIGADGKPFATLVNYAVHPEVLGSDTGILSPDLIGPLYDRIRGQGGGTGIFMNSAQGGMVTADNRGPDGKSIRTWAECLPQPPYGTNLTFPLERYTRFHQTSGTTGAPLRWLDTPESWNWMVESWTEVFRAAGATASDRVFFAFSFGPFIGFWLAFEAAQRIGCLCIPGGGLSSAARLRVMIDNGATILCCTPTYALRLTEVAAEEDIDLRAACVKTIIV